MTPTTHWTVPPSLVLVTLALFSASGCGSAAADGPMGATAPAAPAGSAAVPSAPVTPAAKVDPEWRRRGPG